MDAFVPARVSSAVRVDKLVPGQQATLGADQLRRTNA